MAQCRYLLFSVFRQSLPESSAIGTLLFLIGFIPEGMGLHPPIIKPLVQAVDPITFARGLPPCHDDQGCDMRITQFPLLFE